MTLKTITLTLVLLSLAISSIAQQLDANIQQLLSKTSEEHPQVCIGIGVLINGEQQFYQSGNISRDLNAPKVDSASVFEIASITKALTGNLLAQAVIEGKIELDNYIEDYLPKQYQLRDNLVKKITMSDLASHQSGLSDIDFRELIAKDSQQPTASVTNKVLVDIFNHTDSLTDYGSYRYSTIGFVLIGQILEQVYQKPFQQLFEEKIAKPLNLERTFLQNFQTENIAQSYNMEGGKQELFEWGVVAPAGLVKSSVADMLIYLQNALDSESVVGKAAKLQENTYYFDEKREIGLGQNIMRVNGNVVFAKTGDTLGQSSFMAYDRDNNWAVVLFMNQNNGGLRNQLFTGLHEILSK